jgi:hypothetical protein
MKPELKSGPWADIAVFQKLDAGKAVEAFLKGKGLQARTYDDRVFRYFLFLRPPRVTYRLQVRQSDFRDADAFLEVGAPEALKEAIHCPSCDSLLISYPQMTRKFILPTILLHLGIIFRVIQHECYCNHCHFVWNLPEEKIIHAPKPAHAR